MINVGMHMHERVKLPLGCICMSYASAMVSRAKDTHTTNRVVRIPDDDWTDFGEIVGDRERSRIIREFVGWYLRRPGVKLPARPVVNTTP